MNMPKIKANEKYVDNGPCEREDCQLYCKSWDNNCKGLKSTYADDNDCPFFKAKYIRNN